MARERRSGEPRAPMSRHILWLSRTFHCKRTGARLVAHGAHYMNRYAVRSYVQLRDIATTCTTSNQARSILNATLTPCLLADVDVGFPSCRRCHSPPHCLAHIVSMPTSFHLLHPVDMACRDQLGHISLSQPLTMSVKRCRCSELTAVIPSGWQSRRVTPSRSLR